jgi:prepilin-type N-terminal cleavage/methylation domain-containing protein
MLRSSRGFTLIELLIVIVLIGTLAAIALGRFSNSRESAFDAVALSDLRNVITASEAYFSDHSTYPSDIADLDFTPSPGITFTEFELETNSAVLSLHIHVQHDKSTNYFHAVYPVESAFDKRVRKK